MTNAIITGATRGIGKAIAEQFILDGMNCAIVARSQRDVDDVATSLSTLETQVIGISCDVTKPDAVTAMVEKAKSCLGSIDVLVNCAGQSGGGITKDITDELWQNVIEVNLNAVFYVTKAVLQSGAMGKGGAIINIASSGGKQGVKHGAPYSASKHGVVGFTKSLGLELAYDQSDITVNAVCPGFVETEMAAKVRDNYAKLWGVTPEETKKRIEARVPIGRYIEPNEVAAMVSYLASKQARGVTAQAINICGGLCNY